MPHLLEIIWSLITYPKIKRLELEKQEREGYSVVIVPDSRGELLEYRVSGKSLRAEAGLGIASGYKVLYTESIKEWQAPNKGEKLTPDEFNLAVRRVKEFMMTYCKDVKLDDDPGKGYR